MARALVSHVQTQRAAYIPSGAILWETRKDHRGREWQVWGCDPLDTAELGLENEGRTSFEGRYILISLEAERDRQDDTYLHEWCHVFFDCAGGMSDAQEEHAVEAISRNGLPVLRAMGLKLPTRPAGWDRLERHARTRMAAFLQCEKRGLPPRAPRY